LDFYGLSDGEKILITQLFWKFEGYPKLNEEIVFLQARGHRILLQTYGLGKNVTNVATSRIINFPWYRKISSGPSFTKILYIPLMIALGFFNTLKFRPDVIHAHLPDGALIAKFLKIFFIKSKKTKMKMTNSTAVKVLNQMISNLEIFPILIMLTFTAGIFLNLLSLIIIVNSKRFNPVHLLVSNLLISKLCQRSLQIFL
jgi:hypothetical protein